MECPACGKTLKEVTAKDIKVDVCDGGCGGIWFDQFELQKVDEPHESAGESLLNIEREKNINIDHTQKLKCPKCADMTMMRHFYSVKRDVEVDECPNCGGFWLDYGELGRIRELYSSEEERKEAAAKYFADIFDGELQRMQAESEEKMEKAQKIARMFRFLCPSNYIPGKQSWGAF